MHRKETARGTDRGGDGGKDRDRGEGPEASARAEATTRLSRRDLLRTVGATSLALSGTGLAAISTPAAASDSAHAELASAGGRSADGKFRLWASACSHVSVDLAPPAGFPNRHPRESLAEAIRQSEGFNNDGAPSFAWDMALHLGDFSATQDGPTDEEGREIVRQFQSLRRHRRGDVYTLAGNHDATRHDEPAQWWFRKWIDPLGVNAATSGVHAAERPYPANGTWERYTVTVGNMIFLIMSDTNHLPPPAGRGLRGGYPAGGVTRETFDWWRNAVEANRDRIIITAHHHVLKDTTVASGDWEGYHVRSEEELRQRQRAGTPSRQPTGVAYADNVGRYHGYQPDGGPRGASYLYFVDEEEDSGLFERYLAANPGVVDLWLGAHTHTYPDDEFGGKSHIARKWGTTFVNCASLTSYHARVAAPKSRLLTFAPGTKDVDIQCYLHSDDYAPRGWYSKVRRTVPLKRPFEL